MKFAIEGDHRQFFKKNGSLEVEALLTEAQLKELNGQIEKALENRLEVKPGRAFTALPTEVFSAARDLWRFNGSLKKLILNPQFAEVASELIEFKPIRFGFDQLYCTLLPSHVSEEFNPYKTLFHGTRNLKEITCIQGVLCGLMICLKAPGKNEKEQVQKEDKSIFTKTAGNAVFFSPELPLDFNELSQKESSHYLMIVYTHRTAIYCFEENDPQTHTFKRVGYVFGDRLSDKLNPILYR